ncbi:hypothetical protein GCM10010517_44700 [Streptosporangium fragile]|uniref:HTH merR-type domain-containing protein n=1 Tax=Streptosporangium fragile TaxID=46186 RepID=A0ABN3W1E8_9ACTN
MNDDLLPIGQFARLCRLSVKQLRHYADLGLLEPARVDPASGYRYYRPAQARQALSIGLLRSLDVPLAAVARVLAGPHPGRAPARVRDDLEAELARRRHTLATLERILAAGLPQVRVDVVREPSRRVATVREVAAGPGDVGRATSAGVARLLAALRAPVTGHGAHGDGDRDARDPADPGDTAAGGGEDARGGGDGPPDGGPVRLTGLFPLDLTEQIPVTVTVTVATGGQVPPGTALDVLDGGVFACATHIGPYNQIDLTAHALLTWCAERGHTPAGPIREAYVSDPAVTPPEQLITRLLIPLEKHP